MFGLLGLLIVFMSQDLKEDLAVAQQELAQATSTTAAGAAQVTDTNAKAEVQMQSSEVTSDSQAQAEKLERTIRHLDMENRKLKLKLERANKAQV